MATTNLSSRDLRRTNRATILRTLYFGGEMSRVDLSQQTRLSTATVANVVAELLNEGSVIEVGSEESLGGRPRAILAINPRYGYLVGVDVGEQHLGLELFDLTLAKVATVQYPILTHLAHPERIATQIAEGIATVLTTAGVSQQESVLGIGVGVPGVVEMTTESVVHAPSVGWNAVPFRRFLEEQIPYRIFLDNGVKAMTQAELLIGSGRGFRHIVVVLMGTGVGAGIVINGALYRGASNSAGEWGHTAWKPMSVLRVFWIGFARECRRIQHWSVPMRKKPLSPWRPPYVQAMPTPCRFWKKQRTISELVSRISSTSSIPSA